MADVFIPDSYLEGIIRDDVPTFDLTTHVLGIGGEPGVMEYFTRDEAVLCGTEEAARIFRMLGATVDKFLPTGTKAAPGDTFMWVSGTAQQLHMGWKCCLNIFEYYSALATKTRKMVDDVHAVNPHCEILTTRKLEPGTKPFDVKAILAGGAVPHRLGLSETFLVFDHHLTFYGGLDKLVENIPDIKARICEKKLFIECHAEDAMRLAEAGADGLQMDKMPAVQLTNLVAQIRASHPQVALIAAGGINASNAAEYAATGVDGLATTCLHFAKPLDMSVRMRKR